MQAHLPLWFQRLPADVRRKLELAEAAAVEARRDTHAQQALNLVAVLASRMPFDEAVDRYIETMGLGGEEGEIVHNRALVALGDSDLAAELWRVSATVPAGDSTGGTPRPSGRFASCAVG
jgi:hypothetical protein